MDSEKVESALVDVILEQMREDRWTAAEMQRRTGIKARSWGNYFTQGRRHVPLPALYAIAHVLGTTGSELMRRAEERVGSDEAPAETLSEHIVRQLSPEAQAQVRAARERLISQERANESSA